MSTCISMRSICPIMPTCWQSCRCVYTIDHMGRVKAADGLEQPPFRTLIDLMKRDEKCWVKVSGCERVTSMGPPFTDAVPFAKTICETAPDRVIWGPTGRTPTSRRCRMTAISSI